MIQLRELITCILQFTYIFPRETVPAIIRCDVMGDGKDMDTLDSWKKDWASTLQKY